MKLINQLKTDVDEMIKLSKLIGMMEENFVYLSDLNNANFNQEKADYMKIKMNKLSTELETLRNKWI